VSLAAPAPVPVPAPIENSIKSSGQKSQLPRLPGPIVTPFGSQFRSAGLPQSVLLATMVYSTKSN
jgi:hypothetical protein